MSCMRGSLWKTMLWPGLDMQRGRWVPLPGFSVKICWNHRTSNLSWYCCMNCYKRTLSFLSWKRKEILWNSKRTRRDWCFFLKLLYAWSDVRENLFLKGFCYLIDWLTWTFWWRLAVLIDVPPACEGSVAAGKGISSFVSWLERDHQGTGYCGCRAASRGGGWFVQKMTHSKRNDCQIWLLCEVCLLVTSSLNDRWMWLLWCGELSGSKVFKFKWVESASM